MKRVIWMLYGIVLCAALGIAGRSLFREKHCAEETIDLCFEEGKTETAQIGGTYQLPRGVYRVTVDYKAGTTNHYIFASSEADSRKVGCDRLLLERAKERESFLVWVSGGVEDLRIMSEYAGVGDFSISHIALEETGLGIRHDLFITVLAALILFFLLKLGMRGFFDKERLIVLGGLFVITLLASIPLYFRGVYLGHDGGFHLTLHIIFPFLIPVPRNLFQHIFTELNFLLLHIR